MEQQETPITQEEYDLLQSLLRAKQINQAKKLKMQQFMQQFINPSISFCDGCGAQARYAHKRLMKWAEKQNFKIY